jgi:hypothetical protein
MINFAMEANMTKKTSITLKTYLAASIIFLLLAAASALPAHAAAERSIAVAAGQTSFSFDLTVEESVPYAGIEFGLTLSDEAALEFTSFTQGADVSGAAASPFMTARGTHYFGFYAGTNAFSGSLTVGTLNFTYTGDAAQTIVLNEMQFARIDGNTAVGTKRPSPVLTITVTRAPPDDGTGTPGDTDSPPDDDTDSPPDDDTDSPPDDSAGTPGGTDSPGSTDSPSSASAGTGINPQIVIGETDVPLGAADGAGGTDGTDGTDAADADGAADGYVNPFIDVHESDWFYDDVKYAVIRKLFNGTAPNLFSPNAPTTRGMLVTVLGRLDGADVGGYAQSSFSDVGAGEYYAPYVEWARENGVVRGVSEALFDPGASVTRQDAATILSRYAALIQAALPETRQIVIFADDAEIAAYAKDAVAAMQRAGVINGKPNNLADPLGSTTRAETAALLRRFSDAAQVG